MHQHRAQRIILAVAAVGLLIAPAVTAAGQSPDNTKINARDRSKDAQTADQQKNNLTDRELTRAIRRALTQDKATELAGAGHVTDQISIAKQPR